MDYICDDFVDCPYDTSDEEQCSCQNLEGQICKHIIVQNGGKLCGHLYYTALTGECHKHNKLRQIHDCKTYSCRSVEVLIKNSTPEISRKSYSQCNNESIFERVYLNDLIPDCGPYAEDEPIFKICSEQN